jgi:hypothetical protein
MKPIKKFKVFRELYFNYIRKDVPPDHAFYYASVRFEDLYKVRAYKNIKSWRSIVSYYKKSNVLKSVH